MYLFVDTETTGFSRAESRSVQIAWILSDTKGNVLKEESHIIKPVDFDIGFRAEKIHGITKSNAMLVGVDLIDVLKSFKQTLDDSDVLIGHNIQYDVSILQNDIRAAGLSFPLFDIPKICTMKSSASWCRISKLNGAGGFKWPTLNELHFRCFGEEFIGAHDALRDIQATKRCFFKLIDCGVIARPSERAKLERVKSEPPESCKPSAKDRNTKSYQSDLSENKSAGASTVKIGVTSGHRQKASKQFTSTMAIKGHCKKCAARFSVTLARYETSARCPECYSLEKFDVKWNS